MLWPLMFLTLVVGGLATYWPLRHGPTRIALYNALGNLLVVLFGTLSANVVIEHIVDRRVGVPGFTRLVYQSIIIVALLSFFAVTAETIHDWSRWRRALASAVALLLVADGAWWVGSTLAGPAWAHLCYNGFGATPWPLLVMNLGISASFLVVAGRLVSEHVRFLRDPSRRLDRGLISWVLVVWSVTALQPLFIAGQTLISLGGGNPTTLMPALDNLAGLSLVLALGLVLHGSLRALLAWVRYALYVRLEPGQRWILRNLHAAYTLAHRERVYLEGTRDSRWRRTIAFQSRGQQARVALVGDHRPIVVSLLNRAGPAMRLIRRCHSCVSCVLRGEVVQVERKKSQAYVRYAGEREHLWRFANAAVLHDIASLPLCEGWPVHAIRSIKEAAVLLTANPNNALSPASDEHIAPDDEADDAEVVRRRELEESIVVSDGYRIVTIVAGPDFYPDLRRQWEGPGWRREAATVLMEILARRGTITRERHDWPGTASA